MISEKVVSISRLTLLVLLFATAAGCTDWDGYDIDYFWENIPVLSTMRHSVSPDPYEMPRLPAEHSIPSRSPAGDVPGPFTQAELDSVGATLTSPYGADVPPEVLARGEVVYNTQCVVCHGPAGAGDGHVVGPGKFPFAAAIDAAATAARSDGYIYGIITVGRGLMPPYGEKVPNLDRWAVVSYVRKLERQEAAVVGAATTPAPAPATAGQ